jgi:predicted metal-binding protein/predicted O-methyltransferase YrrM
MKGYDPHTNGGQYLEDISTAYWVSDALFTALELNIFEIINDFGINGATLSELNHQLNLEPKALHRYFDLLISLGLIDQFNTLYYNSLLSKNYLLKKSPLYQGDSILWRKNLINDWKTLKASLKVGGRVNFLPADISENELNSRRGKYINAMDNVAKLKAKECTSFFNELTGNILDVGTGSGAMALAFIEQFPDTTATLLDIEQILPYTKKMIQKTSYEKRITYHTCNILESQWKLNKKFKLIILSNIVHAYAEKENETVLKTAIQLLEPDGIILIHDFFNEHYPVKAKLSDVNMMLNTYNGKVFSGSWVINQLKTNHLITTPLIPLETDTGVIFGAKSNASLNTLALSNEQKLIYPIKALGFEVLIEISPQSIVFSDFSKNKCQFGCDFANTKNCESNHLSMLEMKAVVSDYSNAFLIKGEPPTQSFQRNLLKAEALAFKAGFHKAFILWAGPCSICASCDPNQPCQNTKSHRPSMEGSGIDVYQTVRNNGETIKTLSSKNEMIKYYGLLLLT